MFLRTPRHAPMSNLLFSRNKRRPLFMCLAVAPRKKSILFVQLIVKIPLPRDNMKIVTFDTILFIHNTCIQDDISMFSEPDMWHRHAVGGSSGLQSCDSVLQELLPVSAVLDCRPLADSVKECQPSRLQGSCHLLKLLLQVASQPALWVSWGPAPHSRTIPSSGGLPPQSFNFFKSTLKWGWSAS